LLGASFRRRARRAPIREIKFYETAGISIAVGTVLGASTLPLYNQPRTQLIKPGYSTSFRAVTGLGIWFCELFSRTSQERNPNIDLLRCSLMRMFAQAQKFVLVSRKLVTQRLFQLQNLEQSLELK